MKTILNPKVQLSADGKSVTITADVVDQAFNQLLTTRVSHGHLNPINTKHPRMVQSSNAAVFLKSRRANVSFPNDTIVAIAAAIEPATSFAPVFDKSSVPGNVKTISELPVTYQWQISDDAFPVGVHPPPAAVWTDIAEATSPILDLTTIADGKWIRCEATNAAGVTITQPARILAAPTITVQPNAATGLVGTPASISVTAAGLELKYQWSKNNIVLPKEIKSEISFAKLTSQNAGNYSVMVSNDAGRVTSVVAALTVTQPTKA